MRIDPAGWALALALGASSAAGARADEPELRFDPFERPVRQVSGAPSGRPSEPWQAQLRATLVAGPKSLANLGGTILAIGQEAHGYKLVQVWEREAAFLKDGAEVLLKLDPPEAP